jgi:hypothetical protein
VRLHSGTLSAGGFAWIEDQDANYWIPRFRFERDGGADVVRRRAAAESVVWDLQVGDADTLEILVAPFGDPMKTESLHSFKREDGHVVIFVSNNPARRCQGRLHPGRMKGSESGHFTMLYDALQIQIPGDPIPVVPQLLRSKWWHLFFRNSTPHRAMKDHQIATTLFGKWAPPAGTTDRPLCIPPR